MIQNWFRSGLVLIAFAGVLHGQSRDALIQSVNSTPGWAATGTALTYNESNIDAFDSKLAPILRTYGINGVSVQAWKSPAGQVRATLYQFQDASAAYGFFTLRRKADGTASSGSTVGTESIQSEGHLYFWQSSYVVRLDGEPRAAGELAKNLSEHILGRSQRPPIAAHLPSTNIIGGSEEYILDAPDRQNVEGANPAQLGFDSSVEVATAGYRVQGKTAHLLLVLYPTQQIAKKFTDRINAATPDLAGFRKRIGPLLAIVSGTSDSSVAQSVLDQVHYESKVTWSEPQPGLGLGPVIVTVFTFIAILLGLCIVVGISFGGVRILMKTLYPNQVFGRAKDTEFIQLKLDQGLTRKELSE